MSEGGSCSDKSDARQRNMLLYEPGSEGEVDIGDVAVVSSDFELPAWTWPFGRESREGWLRNKSVFRVS